jgi:hypothetical protein
MRLHSRLRSLERFQRKRSKGLRCRICRERPAGLMVTTRQSVVGDERGQFALVPDKSHPEPLPETAPCPQCKWQPQVIEIVEIVVHTREEVRWARTGMMSAKAWHDRTIDPCES